MNRRNFIGNTGIATGTLALTPYAKAKAQSTITNKSNLNRKFKFGLQLFSINNDMMADPLGTLKKVKAMGYEDFEIYGFDADQITYYGLPAVDFKKALEDMALTVTSGHYGFDPLLEQDEDAMRNFVDGCIQGAKALDCPYITWPWLDPKRRNMETFRKLPAILNRIGKQVTDAGLGFAYHNHGFEFENHDGEIGYDLILNETDPELVKLQMDMYWVVHAGVTTPIQLVKDHPGRFVMWHVKDMDRQTRDYTELGNGAINYLNILPDSSESGLEYYYVEQGGNFTHSALQSANDSLQYLKGNLVNLL